MENEILENLKQHFQAIYGNCEDVRFYFAPGRVNLIGEHIDYNGGYVFPCALTIGTYLAARKRNDDKIFFYSLNFKELGVIQWSIKDLTNTSSLDWANYPLGMFWAFKEKGIDITCGFDLLYFGNIPNGSGLSSSASIEIVTGTMIKDMFTIDSISNKNIALLGQFSENNFNKVNCGIMDQFSIAMGKKDYAIFLDTASLNYEYAPIRLNDAKLVIVCSNKKRGLNDSKYNQRRSECETALSQLKNVSPISNLCDLSLEEFEKYKSAITDTILLKRARHAISENERTKKAVEVLKLGDICEFGKLMNQSHDSLKEDYEVTGIELDTLVDLARKQPGVLGARMTGAGFGGCTINIVESDNIPSFIENVGKAYEEKIGYKADFYVVKIGDGSHRIY